LGWVLIAGHMSAETLFASYFDIFTSSSAGKEVVGKVHLRSNYDVYYNPIPANYSFSISDPSGIFEIEDQRDSDGRLFGVLKVAPGQTVSSSETDYPMSVILSNNTSELATANITVKALDTRLIDSMSDYGKNFVLSQSRLYGEAKISDSLAASYISDLEVNGGRLSGYGFYANSLASYTNSFSADGLSSELISAIAIIGQLGQVYMNASSIYGPNGNPANHVQLKEALYEALIAYADRLPMEPFSVNGEVIGEGDYGDGFFGLYDTDFSSNGGSVFKVIDHSDMTHIWRFTDPLAGPATLLMPDIVSDAATGNTNALALRERLIELNQITFGMEIGERSIPSERWDDLSDTNHTEGALSDANIGHRSRTWMCLPTIWWDYNRPVSYLPYWYDEYYPGESLMPGWEPSGVMGDLNFWFSHFHRSSHDWGQSGFHPDGTVSHHRVGDSSDVAMNAYGYSWLTDPIHAYELFRGTPYEMGNEGLQFIADRYLYSYDKYIYKEDMDFTVCGRSYFSDMSGPSDFVDNMTGDIDRLLAAKQPGAVISNETELVTWRDAIDAGAHEQSGNFPFWVAQSMIHRRGGQGSEDPYYFSVKMENDRTSGAEDFEGVKKSWHAGSGILQAKVRGDEYDKTRYNWDWHALPGLTDEWRTDAMVYDKTYMPGGSAYAGMATDGRYGFAAMEYRSPSGSYSVAEADKGFFFTEKEAVALGANITRSNSGQSREIITTVDQTLWVGTVTYSIDGAAPSTITKGANTDITLSPTDVSWIHQGSVGYVVFPDAGQSLYIRGGDSVNVTDPAKATGGDVIHFALGHGTNPTAGNRDTYHYVMVPNMTAAEMPAYVTDLTNRVEIVANGSGVQGIYDSSLELLQVAFYSAGTAQTTGGLEVSSDRAALVQMRKVAGDWVLCATDPLHEYAATEINLQISEPLTTGSYCYNLPGIYPMAGESVAVSLAVSGVSIRVDLPDAANDAAYNYQGELYAGAPLLVTILGGSSGGGVTVVTVASDGFPSNTWSGGMGWSGDWVATTGTDQPEVVLLSGNYSVELHRGEANHSITRTLASGVFGGALLFKWDVDSLESSEYAYAEVYDGSWHTAWSMGESGEGVDMDASPDYLQEASVDLGVYGMITQVRFSMSNNTKGGDYFYVDDVEFRTVVNAYQAWSFGHGLTGGDAGLEANPDGDVLNNLAEYALGGVPTNGTIAAGILPTVGALNGSVFEYIYRRRTNHVELGLSYWVERNTNLVSGTWTTNDISFRGTAPAETGFETVTNEILTRTESEQYIRLKIQSM